MDITTQNDIYEYHNHTKLIHKAKPNKQHSYKNFLQRGLSAKIYDAIIIQQ